MQQKEHKKQEEPPISALAQDKTYGEKKFDRWKIGVDFFVNLVLSAGFTYWVSHSKTPFRLPFGKEALSPAQRQEKLAHGIQKLGIMKTFGELGSAARVSVSRTMANLVTLLTAGHFVMIPSVWIGAKLKPGLVEKWDRAHYGEAAAEDPSLKLRHALVAAEERPTLFGAVVGRLGSILATQATAYTIGNGNNIPNLLAKKYPATLGWMNFRGIDHFAENVGGKLGGAVTETFPTAIGNSNRWLEQKGFGWSNQQRAAHPELQGMAYGAVTPTGAGGGAPEHFGRYLVSDISYTLVTAISVMPIINFCKQYIPFMTYKPRITNEQQATLDAAGVSPPKPRARMLPVVPTRAAAAERLVSEEKPGTAVHEVTRARGVEKTADMAIGSRV